MTLPANIGFGLVTGRFTMVTQDSPDVDRYPEGVPAVGTVTFTARPAYFLDPSASVPTTVIPQPVVCTLDNAGDLVDAQGAKGVYLIATDDPDLNPVDWTWQAVIVLGAGDPDLANLIRDVSFALPKDTTVDLTSVIEIPSDLGTPISQGPKGDPGPEGPTGPVGPAGPAGSATTSQPVVGAILGYPGPPDTTTKATTPWPAGWVPGDLDLRALVAPRLWVSAAAQSLVSVFDPATTPTLHSFAFQIVATGRLQLNVSVDGATMVLGASTVNVPGALDGKPLWVRGTYAAATGVRNFYTSPANDGVNWTQFDTKTSAPAGPPKPSTRPVFVGMRDAATTLNFGGLMYACEVRDGIGGAIKAGIDTRGRWTGIGVAGNVWTIAGAPYWYPIPQAAL